MRRENPNIYLPSQKIVGANLVLSYQRTDASESDTTQKTNDPIIREGGHKDAVFVYNEFWPEKGRIANGVAKATHKSDPFLSFIIEAADLVPLFEFGNECRVVSHIIFRLDLMAATGASPSRPGRFQD